MVIADPTHWMEPYKFKGPKYNKIKEMIAAINSNADHGNLAGLADDDHTQYIKADGTRAFSGDQSMGSNKLTNVVDPTAAQDGGTKNYIDKHCMIGSANSAWWGLPFNMSTDDTQIFTGGGTLVFKGGLSDFVLQFVLPLPTNRGGLKLYVKGVKILVFDADANDYVKEVYVSKALFGSATNFYINTTANITSAQSWSASFTAEDCSTHDMALVFLVIQTTTNNELDLRGEVFLDCYYDT